MLLVSGALLMVLCALCMKRCRRRSSVQRSAGPPEAATGAPLPVLLAPDSHTTSPRRVRCRLLLITILAPLSSDGGICRLTACRVLQHITPGQAHACRPIRDSHPCRCSACPALHCTTRRHHARPVSPSFTEGMARNTQRNLRCWRIGCCPLLVDSICRVLPARPQPLARRAHATHALQACSRRCGSRTRALACAAALRASPQPSPRKTPPGGTCTSSSQTPRWRSP